MSIAARSISTRSGSIALLSLGLALAMGLPTPLPAVAADSADEQVDEFEELKQEWQGRYRQQLQEAARLRRNAAQARENYSQAQRRNYPRGGARQQFLLDADEAERDLEKVEAGLEQTISEGRLAGALPGWFDEVDEEPIMVSEPAAPSDGMDARPEDREGRNPLYFDQDDDE
jgi:hypothetical protein